MTDEIKRKLRVATIVYWILLVYIIAALVWWAISLLQQTNEIYELKKSALQKTAQATSAEYTARLHTIEDEHKRSMYKYLGEGAAFLLFISVGAVFIYRSVRRQFNLQQQQQNFAMAITHELKTPIAVSRINLETLRKYNLDEVKREKLLQMTLQETIRLDALINNILISSQLEGSSYSSQKEEINFSDLVSDVAREFSVSHPDRKLNISVEPEIDITGDSLLLKLLVSNLLENAHKYSPGDKPVFLQLRKQNGVAELIVVDEGSGIPDSEKKNVFKKFYRVGNEQTRKTKGTGLGLFLCKKIAKDHKGGIIVEDNHPGGSKFIVHLPL